MGREAIFIGYRREDTADVAGRLFDALARRFGRRRIFKDVDSLRPGADFGDHIRALLPRCRVVLVLIGPHWLDATDDAGVRRLDDPHDWVRVEIETALSVPGLDVVPVLVNGARAPRADELPESLRPLLRRHAATLRRDPDFHDDVERLANALRASLRTGVLDIASDRSPVATEPADGPSRARRFNTIAAMAAAVAALALVGWGATHFFPIATASRDAAPLTEAEAPTESQAVVIEHNSTSTPTSPAPTGNAPHTAAANPCAGAETAWARLRTSTDLTRLQQFARDTPETCGVHADAQARIAALPQAAPTETVRSRRDFDDCGGAGWCPIMLTIPAGDFMMGSPSDEVGRDENEGPQRRVTIRGFAASKFEVTFDQWSACAQRGGCRTNPTPRDFRSGHGAHPVMNVSWTDAQEYVAWLTRETGRPYRLLTEAEWEYAARAGTTTPYPTGQAITTAQANFNDSVNWTRPVGAYPANAFGLHDMQGNVWEWTQDCYASSYAGLPSDGSAYAPGPCTVRVGRGGSRNSSRVAVRSAYRRPTSGGGRSADFGFRVARTLN